MKHHRAFTLVEFLVVLSIIGMLVMLLMPSVTTAPNSPALGRAIRNNDVERVKSILEKPIFKSKHYPLWLRSASYSGSLDVCKFFIEELKTPINDNKLLHGAAHFGNQEVIDYLIQAGAPFDLTGREYSKRTLLHNACIGGSVEFTRTLLKKMKDAHVPIDTLDSDQKSALHHAAENGHEEIFHLLIDSGAKYDVHKVIPPGQTLLHLAAIGGNGEICKFLLAHGADLNAKTYHVHMMPIHYAAGTKHDAGACQTLIDAGADIEVKTLTYKDGLPYQKPIEYANSAGALNALINAGAGYDLTDSNLGTRFLEIAVRDGDLELCKRFVSEGVEIQQTLLHLAAQNGRSDVCAWLLGNGVDIETKNADGKTALHVAAFEKNVDGCRFLLEHGADLHAKDSAGRDVYEIIKWGYQNENKNKLIALFREYQQK